MKKKPVLTVLMLCAGLFFAGAAHASDLFSVEMGKGNLADLYRIAMQTSWDSDYPILIDNQIRPFWAVSVTEMIEKKYRDTDGLTHTLTDFGFTPILRWQGTANHPAYAELGIGINYMTEKYNNNNRAMSSDFQFGDHIGIGYVFSNGVDLNLNFQHYSDAGIRMPNPAVNFVNIRLGCFF